MKEAPAKTLQERLEEVARVLQAGDALAAREAMQRLQEACRIAEAAKVRLASDEVSALRKLFNRCEEAASRLHSTLSASLLQAGTSRRAVSAYRVR